MSPTASVRDRPTQEGRHRDEKSGKFSRKDIQLIKKRIVQSILFTDMATMKQLRDEFQDHLNKFNITKDENRDLLIDNSSPETIEVSK